MNKKKLVLTIAGLSLAVCGGSGVAGSSTSNGRATPLLSVGSSVSATDYANTALYLTTAYQDGLGEILLSRIAVQKAASSFIRDYAQKMINDHTRLNLEIRKLANDRNVSLPANISPEDIELSNQLNALQGEDFDRAYIAGSATSHATDVIVAKVQAQDGNDAEVSTQALASLPILQVHLAAAKELSSRLDPRVYLNNAYQDGLFEIKLAQLAVQKASNVEVQKFAQRMLEEHQRQINIVLSVAGQKGATISEDEVTDDQQVSINELARFSGSDFDKNYMEKNVLIHAQDVRQTKQQAEQGTDPDVKSLAQQFQPILEEHLAVANTINNALPPSFLYAVYQYGRAEIQFAHLALLQGSNAQEKAYAQQEISDHTTLNSQINEVTQRDNLAMPVDNSPSLFQAFVDLLLTEDGTAFDKKYMNQTILSHQAQVALTLAETQNQTVTSDQNLIVTRAPGGPGNLALAMLPVLTDHLRLAQQIEQQVNPAATQP